jgi:putative hemolysin
MADVWPQLALVAALVLANAAFAGSEIALISLREPQRRRLATAGGAARTLARLADDPNRFLATIQIGITLAGFLASATAAVTLAEPLIATLSPLGAAARPAAIVLVTVGLTFVTLVFGELAPKRIAMQRAERWGLVTARPLAALSQVARPVIWLLGRATDLVVRAVGADPSVQRDAVTEGELRDMVTVQPELTPQERDIITGAFEFTDRSLREVLVPRPAVTAIRVDMPVEEAIGVLVASRHTRAPVHGGDLDDIAGTVHLRALIGAEGVAGDHVTPALLLPESLGCLDALRRMQAERQQMAIVLSEHGGTEGIVTVEDLLEELVGEIWDEADRDVQAVRTLPDGAVSVPGRFPIHDLPDLGIDIGVEPRPGAYTTVAGLLLTLLGHVPRPGEEVTVGGWTLRVQAASTRSITRVRIGAATHDHGQAP